MVHHIEWVQQDLLNYSQETFYGEEKVNRGHVTIYIGNGQYVAAHGRQGEYARNPAKQISVYEDKPSKYMYVYRFITK